MIGMAGYGVKNYPTNDVVLREILNLLCVVVAVCWLGMLRGERSLNASSSLRIRISCSLPLFLRLSCTVTNARIFILRRTCTGDRKLPPILNFLIPKLTENENSWVFGFSFRCVRNGLATVGSSYSRRLYMGETPAASHTSHDSK